jgi:hypothetical protein
MGTDVTREDPPDGSVAPVPPPDAERSWSAEIDWRRRSGRAHFVVVASADGERPRVIARSAHLSWPPARPEAIGDFTGAADALAAGLLGAGWIAGEDGPAWYRRRFTWDPQAARTAEAPPDRPPTAAAAVRDRAAAGTAAWPAGTEELTRCQIEWRAGYRRSRFAVVLERPAERRRETIGTSAPFAWRFMSPADWRDRAQVAAVDTLAAALLARGWEEVGRGRAWYERRFVWRRDTDAPPRLPDPPTL